MTANRRSQEVAKNQKIKTGGNHRRDQGLRPNPEEPGNFLSAQRIECDQNITSRIHTVSFFVFAATRPQCQTEAELGHADFDAGAADQWAQAFAANATAAACATVKTIFAVVCCAVVSSTGGRPAMANSQPLNLTPA